MALVADVLPKPDLLLLPVAVVAERPVLVADEARIRQRNTAALAGKALRMPVGRHRLDDAPDDEIVALVAARREQDVKVLLAVLATLELVEDAVLELAEALCADKALRMPELPVRVDDALVRLKAFIAPGAVHRAERHVGGGGDTAGRYRLQVRSAKLVPRLHPSARRGRCLWRYDVR